MLYVFHTIQAIRLALSKANYIDAIWNWKSQLTQALFYSMASTHEQHGILNSQEWIQGIGETMMEHLELSHLIGETMMEQPELSHLIGETIM